MAMEVQHYPLHQCVNHQARHLGQNYCAFKVTSQSHSPLLFHSDFAPSPSPDVQVGSLKSASFGTAPGELIIEELPQAARTAGWSIDPLRLQLGAGDRKQVTVK
jgi:hypothetical protein